jgi:DNA phosphorothioation-dependent restriction protein DptG
MESAFGAQPTSTTSPSSPTSPLRQAAIFMSHVLYKVIHFLTDDRDMLLNSSFITNYSFIFSTHICPIL